MPNLSDVISDMQSMGGDAELVNSLSAFLPQDSSGWLQAVIMKLLALNTLDGSVVNKNIVAGLTAASLWSAYGGGDWDGVLNILRDAGLDVAQGWGRSSVTDYVGTGITGAISLGSQFLLNMSKGLIPSHPYMEHNIDGYTSSPFTTEPHRQHWYYFRVFSMPYGWSDPNRSVYYEIKQYMSDNTLMPDSILTSDALYIYFIKVVMPLLFTFKCRSVMTPTLSYESKDIGNTYHVRIPFAGGLFDAGHVIQLEFLLDTPITDLLQIILSQVQDVLSKVGVNIPQITTLGAITDMKQAFSSITSKDLMEMMTISIVNQKGQHHFPYDYLIPLAAIETIYPKKSNGNQFHVVREEVFSNLFVSRPQTQYVNSYMGSDGVTTQNLQTEMTFQKRNFAKTIEFPQNISQMRNLDISNFT